MIDRKGQIWVETVIYTLIALIMIGAVLGFARPKIQEIQDKLTIDQTFEMLEEIDSQISSVVEGGAGNKRVISVEIKKGELKIEGDKIIFTMEESKNVYSEPDREITQNKIKVLTTQEGELNTVTLTLDYTNKYKLTALNGADMLTKSPSAYKLSITNLGNSQIEIKLLVS